MTVQQVSSTEYTVSSFPTHLCAPATSAADPGPPDPIPLPPAPPPIPDLTPEPPVHLPDSISVPDSAWEQLSLSADSVISRSSRRSLPLDPGGLLTAL